MIQIMIMIMMMDPLRGLNNVIKKARRKVFEKKVFCFHSSSYSKVYNVTHKH
jgi:hypothetical protein